MGRNFRDWFCTSTAVLVLAGCAASHQYFEPTERVHGATMQGFREAVYDLVGPRGRFGEAKLWSRGAYRGPNGSTVVQLSLELHNTSAVPIEVRGDEVRLNPVRTDAGSFDDVAPAEHGPFAIPPSKIRELRFHFVLPEHVSPGDVSAFRVSWQVANGDQGYGQRTPFVEEYHRYGYGRRASGISYAYCDPFDPFCYGYGYPYPYPYYGPAYGPVIVGPAARPDRVIVHPAR